MVTVLIAEEILRKGLVLVGYDCRRQDKVSKATNLRRFRAHYGSNPVVYAQIWEDLQITATPAARSTTRTTRLACFESILNKNSDDARCLLTTLRRTTTRIRDIADTSHA